MRFLIQSCELTKILFMFTQKEKILYTNLRRIGVWLQILWFQITWEVFFYNLSEEQRKEDFIFDWIKVRRTRAVKSLLATSLQQSASEKLHNQMKNQPSKEMILQSI